MKHTITHYSDIDFTVHGLRITHTYIALGSVCSNYSWLHNILFSFSHFFRLVWTSRDSRKCIESHTFNRPAWYSCIRKKTIYLVSTRFYYPLSFAIELQRRIFEDFWGGPLILDPWFCSYFWVNNTPINMVLCS